jgi:hypothetical protein
MYRSSKVVRLLIDKKSKYTDDLGLCKVKYKVPSCLWDKQFYLIPKVEDRDDEYAEAHVQAG